jgi:hypothetical protein
MTEADLNHLASTAQDFQRALSCSTEAGLFKLLAEMNHLLNTHIPAPVHFFVIIRSNHYNLPTLYGLLVNAKTVIQS